MAFKFRHLITGKYLEGREVYNEEKKKKVCLMMLFDFKRNWS